MSPLHSSPDGYARLGWRFILGLSGAFWLAPSLVGLAVSAVVRLLGPEVLGASFLPLGTFAAVLLVLPLITWGGFALMAIGSLFLVRRGWFGWLSALGLGSFSGLNLALYTEQTVTVLAGAVIAAFLRLIFALKSPASF